MDAQKERGLTRGQGLVLIALALAVAGVYALVAVMARGPGARRTVLAPAQESGTVSLSEAHARAQEIAIGWQADARLVGVMSGWQVDELDPSTLRQSAWTFRYYSRDARTLQIVSVEPEGAGALHQIPVRQAPPPVDADWSFTGEDMLLTYLAYGGQAFLGDHPRASLRLQLSAREGGRSIWYLSAIDPEAGASHQVQIDALSREVLN